MPAFKNFLNKFNVDRNKNEEYDDEEYDDDIFEEDEDDYDDEDDEIEETPSRYKASSATRERPRYSSAASYQRTSFSDTGRRAKTSPAPSSRSNVVPMNEKRPAARGKSNVIVIKPLSFDDAQEVSDNLKDGKTIVINLEGVEVESAQRIIDFIGGACYGIDGVLKAISANIFIAAPNNTEVSGDLREEIFNDTLYSPSLTNY